MCTVTSVSQGLEKSMANTIWLYWEGPKPAYIALCCETIRAHNEGVVELNRESFEPLFTADRDIEIDRLSSVHRSDFIRAYLLKHYGGLYIDPDCVMMRSLVPVLHVAWRMDFVGYREPMGSMSGSFMATRAHGSVITDHYHRVCAAIRSRRPLEWLDLTSVPLERAVLRFPAQSILLPTERIMPISWVESALFCVRRSDEEHERHLAQDAYCYMLSNNTLRSRQATRMVYYMPDYLLLEERYFLSFLLRKSLSRSHLRDNLTVAPTRVV